MSERLLDLAMMNTMRCRFVSCLLAAVFGVALVQSGCATRIPVVLSEVAATDTLAFGRVHVTLSGPTTRAYPPTLRFFEVVNETTGERFRVDVQSDDASLFLKLPPGEYELSRVVINEGAFQAASNPGPLFRVEPDQINYVGTWQFGVASPTYDRKVLLSVANEVEAASRELETRYPELRGRGILTRLPDPPESITRLYEVDPYPLIWWFRRHHTS